MIKHLIFDFGGVLVDWNPRYVFVPWFGDAAKAERFLSEICPYDWNAQVDTGRTTAEVTEERVSQFPEWETEIRMYYGRWIEMLHGEIPGMEALVREYKGRGYHIWGLTNWSRELFPLVRNRYPVFDSHIRFATSFAKGQMNDARMFKKAIHEIAANTGIARDLYTFSEEFMKKLMKNASGGKSA